MRKSMNIQAVIRRGALSIALALCALAVEAAGYLSDDKVLDASVTDLAAETSLFKTLQQGIALSLAACKSSESCQPAVNRDELEGMIASLNIRIENLSQRFEEKNEEDLAEILVRYSEIRDACNGYLEQLTKFSSGKSGGAEEDDLGEDEFDIFQDADEDL
jgi:hypothetical protein